MTLQSINGYYNDIQSVVIHREDLGAQRSNLPSAQIRSSEVLPGARPHYNYVQHIIDTRQSCQDYDRQQIYCKV